MTGLGWKTWRAPDLFPALLLALVANACLDVSGAFAQSTEQIIRALQPRTPPKPLVRSYGPNRGIAIEGPEPQEQSAPSIDLMVNFEYDQSALTMSDAQIIVDTLGRALNDPRLSRSRFMIIGHTDARGGAEYNLALSQRRAEAVRQRLVQFHRVSPDRLTAEGHGMRELSDPSRPLDAVNRRVQIKTIIGSDTPVASLKPSAPVARLEPPAAIVTPEPSRPNRFVPLPPQTESPNVPPPAANRFNAPPRQDANKERPPLLFEPLPQRPRPSIYQLPSQPEPPAPAATGLPVETIAAFSRGSASAASVLLAKQANRVGVQPTPTDAQILDIATVTLGHHPGLTAFLGTAPTSLSEDRMRALLIAEVFRKLESAAPPEQSAPDKAPSLESLDELFARAADDVYSQSLQIVEAQNLTRTSQVLVDAVNDLSARSVVLPGFETVASDRGKMLMSSMVRGLPEMEETDGASPLEQALMRRDVIGRCLIHLLPSVTEVSAVRPGGQRTTSANVRMTDSAHQVGASANSALLTQMRASCLSMLPAARSPMAEQEAPIGGRTVQLPPKQ